MKRRYFTALVLCGLHYFCSTLTAAQQVIGTVPGTFSVTLSGSAVYSVPLRIAPGTAGVEPKLSLVYNSQSLSGPLGAGWSIAGLSIITRGPKNARSDQVPDGVRMEETDAIYLDGQRLIAIRASGSGAGRKIEYRKEIDDQTRVVETGADFGSSMFIVNTKGGLKIEFDSLPGAPNDQNRGDIRFSDSSVLLRAESRLSDSTGNFIDFFYLVNNNGNYDVKSVQYTGHATITGAAAEQPAYARVNFEYESSPRVLQSFVAGRSLIVDTRLKGILTQVASKPDDPATSNWLQVARYSFDYEDRDTANRFVLKSIHQYGEDNAELTPTTFSYSKPMVGWKDADYSFPAFLAKHEELAAGYRFAHISSAAGNLPDLLYATQVDGQLESFAFQNNGNSWSPLDPLKPPIPFTAADGSDLGVIVADVNGDGRADLLQSYQVASQPPVAASYIADSSGWKSQDAFKLPFVVSRDGKTVAKFQLYKWTSGAGPDLLYQSGTDKGFLVNTSTGWRADARYAPPFDLNYPFWVIDVDCSGKASLMAAVKDDTGKPAWKIFKFGNNGWSELTAAELKLPFRADVDPDAIRIVTVDNSNCSAVLVATSHGEPVHAMYQASAAGWKLLSQKQPAFDLVSTSGQSVGAAVADFGGKGLSDVVANQVLSNGDSIKFAYFQTSNGWKSAPANFNVPVLSHAATAGVDHMYIADFNGDGRSEIALPTNSRQSFGQLFIATDNGFVEKPDFAPPVAFARKDHQDQGVRLVDVNGDGLPDLLVSRSGGPSTGAWINTGSGWSTQTGLAPPVPFAGDDIAGSPTQFVDVDGDGYVDLLYSYRGKDGVVAVKLLRNVSGPDGSRKWSDASSDGSGLNNLIPPTDFPFAADKIGDMGVRFADVTGTGRAYMLVGYQLAGAAAKLTAFKNDGTKWIPAPEYAPPVPFVAQIGTTADPTRDLFIQIVDVNADGLPDIVAKYHDPTNPSITVEGVWLNTGTGWSKSPTISVPIFLDTLSWDAQHGLHWDKNASIQWADVNGDGLPDIIYTRREGNTNNSVTYLASGKGWVASPQWQIPIEALPDRGADPGLRVIDINGDGYPDLLFARQEADGTLKKGIYVNNGAGWISQDSISVPDIPFVDKDGNDLGVRLLDVDGRGLVDVIQAYSGDSPQTAIKINQARRSDVVQTIDAGYGLETSVYYQSLVEPFPADLGSSQVALKTEFNWQRVYEPDRDPISYPIVAPVPATYAVRRVVVSEGPKRESAFSYRYGGYHADALSKRSLGFHWRDSISEANGVATHTEMSQEIAYPSKLLSEETCWLDVTTRQVGSAVASNVCSKFGTKGFDWVHRLTKSENKWAVETLSVGGGALPLLTLSQISLLETASFTYELDGRPIEWHTDSFTYDEPSTPQTLLDRRMNVIRSRTVRGDHSSCETVSTYDADDSARWYLGRLTKSVVTRSSPPGKNVNGEPKDDVRAVGFSYDHASGLLTSETINLGTTREVTTSYRRDAYGNITEKQIHAGGIADADPTTFAYDRIGRFLVTTTNPLKHKLTQSLSSTAGFPTSIVDANGVETTYEYDGFGRLLRLHAPTGTDTSLTATTEYLGLAAIDKSVPIAGVAAAYAVRLQATDGQTPLPYTYKLLDAKGRTLRSITEGFTKNARLHRYILRDTIFDLFGQPIQFSLPYEANRQPIWSLATYDVLGRQIKEVSPGGGTIRVSYKAGAKGGLITTTIDSRTTTPLKTIRIVNMRALPVEMIDSAGGKIFYEYDAGDKPTKVTDAIGSVARYVYDDFGNRKHVSDPDIGNWTYEYDSLGRLIRQIDGNPGGTQVSRFEYDSLSRLRKETRPTEVWTWEYDTATHGIGKVATIKDDAGKYQQGFSYDEVGRSDQIAVTIGRDTYTTVQVFDSYGRLAQTNYPENLVVDNTYDEKGFLIKVANESEHKTYWSLDSSDALGHVTGATYGNGLHLNDSYDLKTGRPIEMTTIGTSNERILDLNLKYDLAGDLRHREELVGKKSETFGYDQLDRLASLTRGDGSTESYTYDAAGRFKSKGGTNYVYPDLQNVSTQCNQNPVFAHAVMMTVSDTGRHSYHYDCHGNMTGNDKDVYQYSSDNRLVQVEDDPAKRRQRWVRFDYGPDGQRYRERAKHGRRMLETVWVGAYEKITEFGVENRANSQRFVRHRWYLSNNTGNFVVLEKNHEDFDYIAGAEHPGAAHIGGVSVDEKKAWYLHKDQQGSVLAITDEAGGVRARYWYDPWGNRTSQIVDSDNQPSGLRLEDSWSRNFLGQEHLQDFELIHLNGRVYDPLLGLFTSPDPLNQSPLDSQLWNPYSYGRNNPLRYSDPNGYCFVVCDVWNAISSAAQGLGNAISSVGQAVGHAFDEAGKWIGQNWREIVVVAAVIVVTVATAGTGGPAAASLGTAILSGMAAGATAGGLSAALYGGNLNDVLTGAIKGGVIGAVSGAAFYGIGNLTAGGGTLHGIEGVAGHGIVGGARELAYGGNFWHGFESGALTKTSSLVLPTFESGSLNTARAALVGGAAAAIGGGNFSNGAVTGAFSYAFNDAMHPPQEGAVPIAGPIDLAIAGIAGVFEAGAAFVAEMFAEEGLVAAETEESFLALEGEEAASTPVGRSGTDYEFGIERQELHVPEGTNAPGTISGRDYSGHALDRMQSRGIPPSVVENTVQTGVPSPGNLPGRTVFYDPANNISVVTDSATGRVITVRPNIP